MYSDEELVLGCINGCQKCHTMLYNRYYGWGVKRIKSFSPNIQLIEDIVTEAFLLAFKKLNMLGDPTKFKPWFGKILKHLAIKKLESKHERVKLVSIDRTLKITNHVSDRRIYATSLQDLQPKTLHQNAVIEYDVDVILNEINSLPPYMTKCLLSQIEGYKYKEIAEKLNLTEGTVKGYAHRCREKLKSVKLLNDEYSYLMK